ncbi:MAG: type II toxin-antitoxin system RelE/ParE family toxin [Stenotrophomonas sp.]|uniref:type II toxin-antitoxin system RelE/ParE family toxin n=1 Tax=Stenotrophomonas sp. TaxID=69392 RepID=UPI003D6CB98F
MAICSFRCVATRSLFLGKQVRHFHPVQRIAMRKLAMLHAATRLEDLRVPPANRLERLKGDRAGLYSIRVNDQYRICFAWTDTGPADVEICDYH